MTPWIPMMVAGVSLLSSVNIVGLLSYEARRRRRIATYLALAREFPAESYEARAFAVVARDTAADLATFRLVRPLSGGRLLLWISVLIVVLVEAFGVVTGVREGRPVPVERLLPVVGMSVVAVFLEVLLKSVHRRVRASLVEDGWYLDIADSTYLTTSRTRAFFDGPRMIHLDERRKEIARQQAAGGVSRTTERAESWQTWLRRTLLG